MSEVVSDASTAVAAAAPVRSIRERISAATKVGTIRVETVDGFGEVPVRILSGDQVLVADTGVAAAALACVDEQGQPLFNSTAELRAQPWPVVEAMVSAYKQAHAMSRDNAAKK